MIQVDSPDQDFLSLLLQESAARHTHLCPRQILGVRMGLRALKDLKLVNEDYRPKFSNADKRLLTIVETDGCGVDGISIATGCSVGRRTLRVFDFGKLAATMVDTHLHKAVRVIPSPRARQLAINLAPDTDNRWTAYLEAYQLLPDDELMISQEVRLTRSLAEILSRPTKRAICESCGEEIMNEREVITSSRILCRSCAGEIYYEPVD